MPYLPYATELELSAYLDRLLDRAGYATLLGWSVVGGHYQDAINEALERYGTDDITTVTTSAGVRLLNMLGRAELWRQVAEAVAGEHDTRLADGSSGKMSQLWEHATALWRAAEEEVAILSGATGVGVVKIYHSHDPYRPLRIDP